MKKGFIVFYAFLLLAVCLWILHFKNISLHNWLYGSDLGNYDTILQETLKGNFGVEYNYGITFGDHSSYALLLFLPVKLFFGAYSMDFLMAVTPCCYLLCGLCMLYFLHKRGAPWQTILLAVPAFIFHLSFFKGNYEESYGFHIDTASGYILVMVAFLLSLQVNFKQQPVLWLILLYVWFVLLKEEMTFLGIIFFGSLWLISKERKYLTWLWVTLVIFAIQLASIHYFNTPFNRGNMFFVTSFIHTMNEIGLWTQIAKAPMNTYWNLLLFYAIIFGALNYFNKPNPIALALFITAMVKSAIGFFTGDYTFDTWHSFPAIAMFTGAVVIQAIEVQKNKYALVNPVYIVLFILAVVSMVSIKTDYRYSRPIKGCVNANHYYKTQIIGYLEEMKMQIPKNKVVAVNEYITVEFADGYRYSLFPRGTYLIPEGIADYVLLNREIEGNTFLAIHKAKALNENITAEFELVAENPGFLLYKRIKPSQSLHRQEFIKFCGANTLE